LTVFTRLMNDYIITWKWLGNDVRTTAATLLVEIKMIAEEILYD
jgi:hypothetical protein